VVLWEQEKISKDAYATSSLEENALTGLTWQVYTTYYWALAHWLPTE